jgi:hypothetical protein
LFLIVRSRPLQPPAAYLNHSSRILAKNAGIDNRGFR